MNQPISSKNLKTIICCFVGILMLVACTRNKNYNPASQNPSPMTESIRSHSRVSAENCMGQRIKFDFQDKEGQLYIPKNYCKELGTNLIIHFHGLPLVSEYAVCNDSNKIIVTINGGSGSSTYEKLFIESENFEKLLAQILSEIESSQFESITLTAWSAGYGAIRALIPKYEEIIDNIILLDGLHTSYIPEKRVLHQGGKLDSTSLTVFLQFAERAMLGEKQMIITHTSIFPGTFASTTECSDYLIRKLKLKRKPLLENGPCGMQQLGEVKEGNFYILSYAGNTAPDHVDHLHGLQYFSNKLKFPN